MRAHTSDASLWLATPIVGSGMLPSGMRPPIAARTSMGVDRDEKPDLSRSATARRLDDNQQSDDAAEHHAGAHPNADTWQSSLDSPDRRVSRSGTTAD